MHLQVGARNRGKTRRAAAAHHAPQLGLQHLEHRLHAVGAVGREAPHHRPPDEHGARAERQRLHDVAASPEPAVHQHLDAALHRVDDVGEHVERSRAAWRTGMAVAGHDDGLCARLRRRPGVVRGHDALHDDRHRDGATHGLYRLPVRAARWTPAFVGGADRDDNGRAAGLHRGLRPGRVARGVVCGEDLIEQRCRRHLRQRLDWRRRPGAHDDRGFRRRGSAYRRQLTLGVELPLDRQSAPR